MVSFKIEDVTHETTKLWKAALYGDLTKVQELLGARADYRVKCSERECTALHIAALMGHDKIVLLLLDHASESDDIDTDTPQRYICAKDMPCRYIDQRDIDGYRPLSYASAGLRPSVINILISHGATPDTEKDTCTYPALHFCPLFKLAVQGCIYSVDTENTLSMDEHENSVERQDQQLQTIRCLLAKPDFPMKGSIWKIANNSDSTRLLELVLEEQWRESLSKSYENETREFLLHTFVNKRPHQHDPNIDLTMLKMLIDYGENPFKQDYHRRATVLDYAIARGKTNEVKYLMRLLFKSKLEVNANTIGLMRDWSPNKYMKDLIDQEFEEFKKHTLECEEAFLMGHHDRLGKQSCVRMLEEELLRMVLNRK
jgi:ankyrin repeat protein